MSKKRIIIICVIMAIIITIAIVGLVLSKTSEESLRVAKNKIELELILNENENEFPNNNFVSSEYKFYDRIIGSASSTRDAQKLICEWYELADSALYDDYILPILDDQFVFGFKYGWSGKDATRSDDYLEKLLVFNSNIVEADGTKVSKFNSKNINDVKKTLDLIYYINRDNGYSKFIDSTVKENATSIIYSISYVYYVYGDWGLQDEVNEVVDTYVVDKLTGNVSKSSEEILSYYTEAKYFKNNLIEENETDPDDIRVYENKNTEDVRKKVDALTDNELIAYTNNKTMYRFPEDFVDNELIQCLTRAKVSATSEEDARKIVKDMYSDYAVTDVQEIDYAYNVIIYQYYNVPNPSPANGVNEILVYKKDYLDIETKKIGRSVADANVVRRILNSYYMRDDSYTIDSGVEETDDYVIYSRYYVTKEKNKVDLCVDVTRVNKQSCVIELPQKEVIKTILIEE